MMTTTGIRLRAGSSLLGSFSFYSDTSEKLSCSSDIGFAIVFTKNEITAKKSSNYNGNPISNRDNTNTLRPLNKHLVSDKNPLSCTEQWVQSFNHLGDESLKHELSVESLLLVQKYLLEKQWNILNEKNTDTTKKVYITGSQVSARKRRIDSMKKMSIKQLKSTIGSEHLQNQFKGYVKGGTSEVLLTQSEVVVLSKKIKIGLLLEEQKLRLKKKLGAEPSDEQLATSMKISQTELRIKQIECTLAREKLTLSNVRLVMSIAQKYDNMGAQMSDLIQGGLIGLLRGIEKYDSSRGFKISTYVYWWIRQGVSRALMENSRILRLPNYLHERQSAIRIAKVKLEEQGISPSIDRIAESLNISRKKVLNATQAITKVFSLDRGGFPSINGLPGQTQDNEIADNCLENNPWHVVDERALKDEVNKLINMSLGERERNIIRLYYGLDNECLTWEDIGRRIGLSREGVRQIGLVAQEKLKNAAKKAKLEAMLVKH